MKIRPATPADAPVIAKVHVRSRQEAYRGLLPDSFLAGLSVERRQRLWERNLDDPGVDVFVAVDAKSEIVGFSSLEPSRGRGLAA